MTEVFSRNVASDFNYFYILIKWYSKIVLKVSPTNVVHLFRTLEKNSVKLVKTLAHRSFNETCSNNKLLPNYTDFKLHDAATRRKDFVHEFRHELVSNEIADQNTEIDDLEKVIASNESDLSNILNSPLKFNAFKHFLDRILSNMETKLRMEQQKKLCKLFNGPILLKKHQNSFINLSSATIPPAIKNIFNIG